MRQRFKIQKQRGIVLTFIAVTLMLAVSILTFYTANSTTSSEKISSSFYRRLQSFEAAEAGVDFGVAYLNANSSSILVDSGNGFIRSYTFPANSIPALNNGSSFTITYSNPAANDFTQILIKSVGTSGDGSSTRTIYQLVKQASSTASNTWALTALGGVAISGNASVSNGGSNALQSGGSVTISGNGSTSGTVTQNITSLSSDPSTFFYTFFNSSSTTVKATAQSSGLYINNTSGGDISSQLNGQNGKIIWVDSTNGASTIAGNVTVGTSSNPVILIVNGSFSMSGNSIINGIVVILPPASGTNTGSFSGNSTINGAVIAGGNITDSGNDSMNFSSAILSAASSVIPGPFAKVPASWRDF